MQRIELIKGVALAAIACAAFMTACSPTQADPAPSPPQTVVTTPLPAQPASGTPADNDSSQANNPPRPKIGFNIGEYLPTDAVVKNRFGAEWFTIGIGEGEISSSSKRGNVQLDLDVLANTKGNNRAILVPIGLQYDLGLGTGAISPYIGASVDVVASVVQSTTDNVKSQLRASAAGSVFAGLNFNHDADLEVRYRAIQKTAGYDFGGVGVDAGLRF